MLTIRKMKSDNYGEVEDFFAEDKNSDFFQKANLGMIIKNQNLVSYYGQYNNESLVSVFMSFHKLWYISLIAGSDYNQILEFIQNFKNEKIIINDVNKLFNSSYLSKEYKVSLVVKGNLFVKKTKVINENIDNIRRAKEDDVDNLVRFYENAPEDVKRGKDSILRSLDNGRRTYMSIRNDDIDAVVLTTGETAEKAMLGGIHFTNDISSLNSLMRKVTSDLISEGKEVLVVVRDPNIEIICLSLGFEKRETRDMIHLQLNDSI